MSNFGNPMQASGGPRPHFRPRGMRGCWVGPRPMGGMMMRPNFNGYGPGYGGGGPMMGPPMGGPEGGEEFPPQHEITPEEVMAWLEDQHPMLVRNVMFHCRWVLEQRGVPLEEPGFGPPQPQMGEMGGWYTDGSGVKRPNLDPMGGPGVKRGFGLRAGPPGPLQWTPAGWVPKDNSHKVTTTMKPLPEPEVIPPNGSKSYPEAAADRDKLKMLANNLNMMTFELTKICKTYKIVDFKKEKMSTYPEEAQGRLQTAVTCVDKAEQTLNEFKEFLKTDKYKEWNEEQTKKHEEAVKQMIGEMPSGAPHNSRFGRGGANADDDDDDDDDDEKNAGKQEPYDES